MLCKTPVIFGLMPVGCGQCLPCRINRRRIWTHRILLESYKHGDSSFVTLTYDERNVPKGGNLEPKHTQDFFKRLRRSIEPRKIRYFLCGEYGENTQRPHYHAAVFGIGINEADVIEKAWQKGFTVVGDLTRGSAQYIAGYVTKKWTRKDEPKLNGRHPEFARMSRRPGIGALAVPDIKAVLDSEFGKQLVDKEGDVPFSLAHGRRSIPLGRYLRCKLREGYDNSDKMKEDTRWKFMDEMKLLYESRLEKGKWKSFRSILEEEYGQSIKNLETRDKIYSQKGKL